MTPSARYRIASAFVAALRAAPDLAGATIKRNPRDPATLKDGPRVVFFEDSRDAFIAQDGQRPERVYLFSLGVINRTADEEAGADADQVAAEEAIRGAIPVIQAELNALGAKVGPLRERETTFRVEGFDAGGALILTTFEVEYRKPKPAR